MAKNDVKYVLAYVKQILFLAQSLEICLKSITNLIVTISAKFIFLRASAVANNMLEKPLGSLGLSGTTIKVMIENILTMRFVSKYIYLDIFILGTGFLENVKIMLIDKTDGQNPKKREDYWRRTLKTYAPFGLNVEDSV